MMMELARVDIVLPCFNPEKQWSAGLLDFHKEYAARFKLKYFIVNDGSKTGNLREDVERLKIQGLEINFVSYEINKGKGHALRQGIAQTNAEYVVYTDIDFPFINQSVANVINTLHKEKVDVAVGYREGDYYKNKFSLYRKILSKTFRFFLKYILKMPITDTQCGLKGFSVKGKNLFLQTTINRYLFDFELIYMAARNKNYILLPVPVVLKENVTFSKMKLKVLVQESFNLLRILIKYAFKKENY